MKPTGSLKKPCNRADTGGFDASERRGVLDTRRCGYGCSNLRRRGYSNNDIIVIQESYEVLEGLLLADEVVAVM